MSKEIIETQSRNLSTASLAQLLFKAELSSEAVRALPAQSLYLAIKHLGVTSCADIIEATSLEQCRLLLDFDCWNKDQFNEDNFFEWLAIADEDHGLKILQKLVKSLDLKIVGLLIAKHVDAVAFAEKTENPPGPGYFTPDLGFTWINVTIKEGTRNFLLTRLLALIFETDTDLFYQLLSIPGVATQTELEEEAYNDRTSRLATEGIPERDLAYQINSPIDLHTALKEFKSNKRRAIVTDIPIIDPLVKNSLSLQPLDNLLQNIKAREDFESELTLIMNSAIVRHSIEFNETEQVQHLALKVRGAINIGLEMLTAKTNKDGIEAYETLGLQKIYRLALGLLANLNKQARKVSKEVAASKTSSPEFYILSGALEAFPEVPAFLQTSGAYTYEAGKLISGYKAFEHVTEIELATNIINREFALQND